LLVKVAIGTTTAGPLRAAGTSSRVSRELAEVPTVITRVRTNRIQRPSREKRGASSLRSLAGGSVSRRMAAPLGESSQIERCWIPN
jgi:hypothetical protein